MNILNQSKQLALVALLGLGLLSNAQAREIDDKARRVGVVRWQKEAAISPQDLLNKQIPENAASIYFIRPQDNDGLQTSANVAINDRFHTSLQAGNYSQILSCVGVNRLSAEITGHKNNDLLRNAVNYDLEKERNYFFEVDVDDVTGAANIRSLSQEEALPLLEKQQRHQVHQITRVVPNCEPGQPPVEKISIELKVLFDTDKHFVKPQYYPNIEEVVDYMRRFPETSVTLEGHTDSRQTDEYNIALSQRRMNAVRNIMIQKYGIDGSRIRAVGYGESRPVAPNDSADNMQLNRRVVAVFDVAVPKQ